MGPVCITMEGRLVDCYLVHRHMICGDTYTWYLLGEDASCRTYRNYRTGLRTKRKSSVRCVLPRVAPGHSLSCNGLSQWFCTTACRRCVSCVFSCANTLSRLQMTYEKHVDLVNCSTVVPVKPCAVMESRTCRSNRTEECVTIPEPNGLIRFTHRYRSYRARVRTKETNAFFFVFLNDRICTAYLVYMGPWNMF